MAIVDFKGAMGKASGKEQGGNNQDLEGLNSMADPDAGYYQLDQTFDVSRSGGKSHGLDRSK